MKLIYINAGNSSVMEAQVLELLKYYHIHCTFSIVLLQGYRNKAEQNAIEKKLAQFSFLQVVWFRTYPNYTLFKLPALRTLSAVLKRECVSDFFIHTRGELYGAYAKIFLRCRRLPMNLLVDIRGVSVDEVRIYMAKNNFLKYNKIRSYENSYRELCSHAPAKITVVSDAAKCYFIEKYGFIDNNISMHPNIAGEQFVYSLDKRTEIRAKLHITNETPLAVCSSNGNAAWQRDVLLMEQLIKQGVTILNLSSQIIDLAGIISIKVPFAQMPDYLSAADYAVLWRDSNFVNETASPSKMSEFACMGLYVIHNGTVDISTRYIKETGAGVVLRDESQLDQVVLPKITEQMRDSWSKLGRIRFGIEEIARDYVKIYSTIVR